MIDFKQAYNRSEFINFLETDFLPDDFLSDDEQLNFDGNYTQKATRLGVCESLGLEIFEVQHTSTHDAHVGLSKEAFRLLLNRSTKSRALVLFIPQNCPETYRFSLVTIDVELDENKVRKTYSNPRRYSYILGRKAKVHTPTKFLSLKGRVKDVEELQQRFSVEVLTKQFYSELFNWYQWALSDNDGFAVTYPNDTSTEADDRKIDEHTIRLITRLIFVWFIKQKNLIPEQIFQANELKNILKNFDPLSKKSGNYYNAILQNLFFATLNRAINEREFAKVGSFQEQKEHYGIKTLFRNTEEGSWFIRSDEEMLQLFKKVPFLNGGLFECLDKEDANGKIFYYDGFSRRAGRQKRAFIPNCLFFEPEIGLIPLLEKYNFTIEENTPNDVEVALDPELLGKVFENLLGAYNPETKETARKQSGSFYTPREIVNYMVDESLMAYLNTSCPDIATETFRQLFNSETLPPELQNVPELTGKIAEKLKEAKILDPACGSGAFPMGILNRMLDLLKKLHTENEHSVYDLKLQLIENCIYGIDIQTIAVQISKLRFFISLICEQLPTNNPDKNYGITSLPNLETKFVAANTLLGLKVDFSDKLDFQDEQLLRLKTKLWDVRHRHFLAGNANEKHSLRKEDKDLRSQIKKYLIESSSVSDSDKVSQWQNEIEKLKIESARYTDERWEDVTETPKLQITLDFGFEQPTVQQQSLFKVDVNKQKRDETESKIKRLESEINKELSKTINIGFEVEADKLAHWDPYNQNKSSDFFDAEWMFGIDSGFDVLIGNPPYVRQESITEYKPFFKEKFETFDGRADLYIYFYEKSIQLLKKYGCLSFISSNKFFRAKYGIPLRKYISEKSTIKAIIDFGELPVFESAATFPMVFITQKGKLNKTTFTFTQVKNLDPPYPDINALVQQKGNKLSFNSIEGSNWNLGSSSTNNLLEKLSKIGTPLKDIVKSDIYSGIKTGYNKAFYIDSATKDKLISADERAQELIKKLVSGDDVRKWTLKDSGLYLIYTYKRIDIENYPSIYQHLLMFKEKLENRAVKQPFWQIQQPQYRPGIWDNPKILYPDICKESRFTIDTEGCYLDMNGFIIPTENYWLLSILNSSLVWWFLQKICSVLGDADNNGRLRLKSQFIEKIPIPKTNDIIQNKLADFSKECISFKKQNKDTAAIEKGINVLVFRLYELTYEEVKVIDPDFWLNKDEYAGVKIE